MYQDLGTFVLLGILRIVSLSLVDALLSKYSRVTDVQLLLVQLSCYKVESCGKVSLNLLMFLLN